MKKLKYIIRSENGIHARPAGLLVRETSKYDCNITVKMDDKEVDAKKIIRLMGLGIKKDNEITVICDGIDEDLAIDEIGKFLKENL